MTAVNVTLAADAAFILTDSATTIGEQTLTTHSQKVLPITHLNACVCVRGNVLMLSALWQVMWLTRATFTEAAERLGDDYRAALEGLAPHFPVLSQGEAYLVGWNDEVAAPELWMAANYDRPGILAFEAQRAEGITPDVSSCPDRIRTLAQRASGAWDRSEDFDPRRDGAELIAGQSAIPGAQIGGLCHLTTIRPGKIEMEILPPFAG